MICNGEPHILFAWALNASGLHLPRDVGFKVGPSVGIVSIVVQIHYGYPERESPNVMYSQISSRHKLPYSGKLSREKTFVKR